MASEGEREELRVAATLAGRLQRLFEVRRSSQDPTRTWRNSEVVAACRAAGRDLSESHLSELRRGLKTNPTMRVLETLAWFFEVGVGYFTDDAVAAATYARLREEEAAREAALAVAQTDREDAAAAARELQQALRTSGVTRIGHRAAGGKNPKEQAAMMRALAKALRDEKDEPDDSSGVEQR